MADSGKGDSSGGKAKEKTSSLDEDISNEFLGSWKSMSMTGGDDMDFNFEPISKGNKKSFDFGKLDMDFSLDGDFGKMSSFKMNMPDLDFSSSPKKSTNSKDKSDEASAKGNRPSKHNDFSFSFDFNGLDDFNLDGPSTKGGKNSGRENTSKEEGSGKAIEFEKFPRQAAKDNGAANDTITKTLPASVNAANSKSEDLLEGETNIDASPGNFSTTSATVGDLIQPTGAQITPDKHFSVNAQKANSQSHMAEKTCPEDPHAQGTSQDLDSISGSSPPKPTSLQAPEALISSQMINITMAKGTVEEYNQMEKGIPKQSYIELKAKEQSATLTHPSVSDVMQASSLSEKLNDGPSEPRALARELPAADVLIADSEERKKDKLLAQCSLDKMKISHEEKESWEFGSLGNSKLPSDCVDSCATTVPETLPSGTRSNTETQRSDLEGSSAPFSSGSFQEKPISLAYKVPGSFNPKLSIVRDTNDGARPKLSILERRIKGLTHPSAENRSDSSVASNKEYRTKSDVNPSSCTKGLVNQDFVSQSAEKNADTDTVSSREVDNNERIRNEMQGHAIPFDGQARKGELHLGSEAKIKDVKSSGSRVSPFATLPKDKNDKKSSTILIQKSNSSEMNKLPSVSIGKKLPGLPSLKISRSITTDRHSARLSLEEIAKSDGNFEKSARLQAVTKMSPPIVTQKQRPLTPSLKRKPSEAADVAVIKLHPPKRPSPDGSRMFNEPSTREVDNEVQRQGTLEEGSRKNVAAEYMSPKFDLHQGAIMEDMELTLLVESDASVEKAEACAKELEDICNMLKKKHDEAKELLVRALVNNNNLLMLSHPIFDEKIRAVQRFADRLMSKELEAGV